MISLDEIDRQILDCIQQSFPLTPQPFAVIGSGLGISEDEVIQRVSRLQACGVIRCIGAVFDIRHAGHVSTLCAVRIAPNYEDQVTAFINSFDEVTHNYARDHIYNIWFTIIALSEKRLKEILDQITSQPGVVDLLNLPAERVYKIQVDFRTSPP